MGAPGRQTTTLPGRFQCRPRHLLYSDLQYHTT
nr:MAG TPA: hypothetical protein [Caudoviricetes sp.]